MSQNPSQSQLVILDAGVIIEAFRTNSWAALIAKNSVTVSRTVMGEVLYYREADGKKVLIDLAPYEQNRAISVIDVAAGDAAAFLREFDPSYIERLDAGELTSLFFLFKKMGAESKICSADSIVYKVLGKLRRSEQGISLEELLAAAGCPKTLEEKFKKSFRERWSREGFSDSFC